MGYRARHLKGSFARRARSRRAAAASAARIAVTVLVASLLCAGCSAGSTGQTGDNSADASIPWPDIVQPDDFTGFCKWSSAPAKAPGDAGDGLHGLGPLTAYWNKSPPHGSHEFPVGTIIVKESNQTDPAMRVVFAMVKRQPRGTGYNSAEMGGADGWEWWSLQDQGDCTVGRLWRGPAPPVTEPYAGMPVGDCNACHTQVVDNDYVWDTALELSHF